MVFDFTNDDFITFTDNNEVWYDNNNTLYESEDLEEAIMAMFKSHNDLAEIFEEVSESEELDVDTVSNLVLGAMEFMNIRINRLVRIYDEMESDGLID